jgi:hypothetical protein
MVPLPPCCVGKEGEGQGNQRWLHLSCKEDKEQ